MYVPPAYEISDNDAWRLIDEVGAGFVVVATERGLRSVFVPLLVDHDGDRSSLVVHVSKANAMAKDVEDGDDAVVLVTADHAYVSPSLYPSATGDRRVAPTWLYDVVEVRGTTRVLDDKAAAERVVRALTAHHEARRDAPWSVDDAAPEYNEMLFRGIVVIEINVTGIAGSAKHDQRKGDEDRGAVMSAFKNGTPREQSVARRMEAF